MEHTGDAAWFPGEVVTHNKACSLALDPFKLVDVCLVVGVPYDGSILTGDLPWWPDPTTRPQPAYWVGEKMGHGLPPRKVHLTATDLQQETPGTPVWTTWTHTGDFQQCKVLGFTISRDTIWSKHINNVCTKANKTLSFLKRNLNISSWKIKEMAYKYN